MSVNKDIKNLDQAIQKLETYLVANHMRKTPERFAILKRISEINKSFTAEHLHQLISPKFHVSLTTVYNSLQLLVKCNLIARHEIENQPARYQRLFGSVNKQYIHLVCINCGKVSEHKDEYLAKLLDNRPIRAFKALYPSFFVYGLCAQCHKRQNRMTQHSSSDLSVKPSIIKKKKE